MDRSAFFSSRKGATALSALFLLLPAALAAQTFTTLVTFNGRNGIAPEAPVMQGIDGNFYGTTGGARDGGKSYPGTVFKLTPEGKLRTLANLGRDSSLAGLAQTAAGDLYGTTLHGGSGQAGTIFKISPKGRMTTLYTACIPGSCNPQGGYPLDSLTLATTGDLYGTFLSADGGYGAVFRMTPGGKVTDLHIFDGSDGATPYGGGPGVIQASDGNFYGTTTYGGAACMYNGTGGCGTVFKLAPNGTFTLLHSFCSQPDCPDGNGPLAGLVQASDGNLYGTTATGGNPNLCTAGGCGTVFRITLGGEFTIIHTIGEGDVGPHCACNPESALIQGTDGYLYGTANYVVYQVSLDGNLTTYNAGDFTQDAPLIQATDGNFYGTTVGDERPKGTGGSVFKFSMGLDPFVKPLVAGGKIGSQATILGNDLTGATSVTFNGTPASAFTVNSTGTAITATVPQGAASGTIQVVTPGGTLSSNIPFRVLR